MTATIVGPGGSVKVRDADGHELEVNADGSINVVGGAGGGGDASEATLQAILTELQQKLEDGQEVALDAATLAALESVTAAVTGTVAVSNMIDPVETGLAKDSTLGGLASDVDRKFDVITPFSAKFSASDAAVIDPGAQRLRIHQAFIQANPGITGNVEYELSVGGVVLDAGWLEASQPGLFSGLYEGGTGDALELTLTPSGKEVRLNVRYKVF